METLSSLVDKSLLSIDEQPGGNRFVMFESLREYGLELLEKTGATGEVRDAHARYFLERAEKAESALNGPNQKAEFDALEADHENSRAALDWLNRKDEVDAELRLCASLGLYWQVRGHLTEGRTACERALGMAPGPAAADDTATEMSRARVGLCAGILAGEQGHYSLAIRTIGNSLAAFERIRDEKHVCRALIEMGMSLYRNGDEELARASFERALNIAQGISPFLRASAENGLGLVDERIGQFEQARHHFQISIHMFSKLGDDRLRAHALMNLANVLSDLGDFRGALEICARAAELSESLGDTLYVALTWNNRGFFHSLLGEHEKAKQCYEAVQRIAVMTGNRRLYVLALAGISEALQSLGSLPESLEYALRARNAAEDCGPSIEMGTSLRVLGEAYLARGQPQEAHDCFMKAVPLLEKYLKGENSVEISRARKGLEASIAGG